MNGSRKVTATPDFFHYRATQRNRLNFIEGLENDAGVWVDDDSWIGSALEQYFHSLFTSSDPLGFEEILSGI